MEKIINGVSKRLANMSSRRGFLATAAKTVIVASGAIAATTTGAGTALAAGQDTTIPLSGFTCCHNDYTYFCSSCPPGSSDQYQWACCRAVGAIDYCDDCKTTDIHHTLVCVIVTQSNTSCT